MNWLEGESVRVIVHAFKPLRDTEIEAVKSAMSSFNNFDIKFAFLHIKEQHPWLLFDGACKEFCVLT